jgi:molybdopterin-binding protein
MPDGKVARVSDGAINAEVVVQLPGGTELLVNRHGP